jgi:GNAT superfamily N-acetyltransferase
MIENGADLLLIERLRPEKWEPAPTGAARASDEEFILVGEDDQATVVGFVHVIAVNGIVHLEQLSVLPTHGRRGYGRMLVEAAKREAGERGYAPLTLRTYADVPWNAPFYSAAGFREESAATPFHQALIETERQLGLDAYGRRVQMSIELN